MGVADARALLQAAAGDVSENTRVTGSLLETGFGLPVELDLGSFLCDHAAAVHRRAVDEAGARAFPTRALQLGGFILAETDALSKLGEKCLFFRVESVILEHDG